MGCGSPKESELKKKTTNNNTGNVLPPPVDIHVLSGDNYSYFLLVVSIDHKGWPGLQQSGPQISKQVVSTQLGMRECKKKTVFLTKLLFAFPFVSASKEKNEICIS